jgi:hypothetical protein
LGLARSGFFFRARLDTANQLETIEKLSFYAQRLSGTFEGSGAAAPHLLF